MRFGRQWPSVGFLTLAGSALLALSSSVGFAQPDFPPEKHLARGNFHTAVFSRNAKLLLIPADRVVQLWDVETGTLIRQFEGHDASIHSIVFSPDERRMLTGAGNAGLFGPDDPTARIWDIASGKQLAVLSAEGHKDYVSSAQFSPEGKQVFAIFVNHRRLQDDVVVSWDIASKEKLFVLPDISIHSAATKWIEPVRLSPHGDMLAGLTEKSLRISVWNARTGKVLWEIHGMSHGSQPQDRMTFGSLEFSPNGRVLIGVCSNYTARTWSTGTGRELQVLEGHKDRICTATFCHKGERVMTASNDGTARLWETASGRQIKRYDHPGPIRELAVSNDSRRMATTWSMPPTDCSEGRQWFTSLWDTMSGREIKRFDMPPGRMTRMVFSPDGQRVLVACKNATLLLEAATGDVVRRLD